MRIPLRRGNCNFDPVLQDKRGSAEIATGILQVWAMLQVRVRAYVRAHTLTFLWEYRTSLSIIQTSYKRAQKENTKCTECENSCHIYWFPCINSLWMRPLPSCTRNLYSFYASTAICSISEPPFLIKSHILCSFSPYSVSCSGSTVWRDPSFTM